MCQAGDQLELRSPMGCPSPPLHWEELLVWYFGETINGKQGMSQKKAQTGGMWTREERCEQTLMRPCWMGGYRYKQEKGMMM